VEVNFHLASCFSLSIFGKGVLITNLICQMGTRAGLDTLAKRMSFFLPGIELHSSMQSWSLHCLTYETGQMWTLSL